MRTLFKIAIFGLFSLAAYSGNAQAKKALILTERGLFYKKIKYFVKDGQTIKVTDYKRRKYKDTLHILNDSVVLVGKDSISIKNIWGIAKISKFRRIAGHTMAVIGGVSIATGIALISSTVGTGGGMTFNMYGIFAGFGGGVLVTFGPVLIFVGERLALGGKKHVIYSRELVVRTLPSYYYFFKVMPKRKKYL